MITSKNQREHAGQYSLKDMVAFLNAHHPGKCFSGFSSNSGYTAVILSSYTRPLRRVRELPLGYRFDRNMQMIVPDPDANIDNTGWQEFHITYTAPQKEKCLLVRALEALIDLIEWHW